MKQHFESRLKGGAVSQPAHYRGNLGVLYSGAAKVLEPVAYDIVIFHEQADYGLMPLGIRKVLGAADIRGHLTFPKDPRRLETWIGETLTLQMETGDHVDLQIRDSSGPVEQLPRLLGLMTGAGLREIKFPEIANQSDGRLWREVPNRKWYADKKGRIPSSREVVLFHRLAQKDQEGTLP